MAAEKERYERAKRCRHWYANGWLNMPRPDFLRPTCPVRRIAMNDKTLLAIYGLKYNPFLPAIPIEAIWSLP
jgi:hypothetical protein